MLQAMQVIGGVLFGLVAVLLLIRLARRYVKFPAPAIAGHVLASGWRLKLYPAETLIERMGVVEGMHVLELGCGSGPYTPAVARAVGPAGKVAALDIQADMIAQLEERLKHPENRDIENVTTHIESAYELPFEDGTFDLVYTIAVLQEIPDKPRALAQVRRILKPDGILAVTELFQDPDYPLRSTTIRDCTRAGFETQAVLGSFWYYTIRFARP
jgi:ubiquinone/menaquinone biosynthesis C-methylase UbiE